MENAMLERTKLVVITDRRHFIGGSDARIIMGQDEKALIRLWQEKRGEVGPEDLSSARLASGTFRYHPVKCIISFADPH
jgi:predicted phage-related endonuclease